MDRIICWATQVTFHSGSDLVVLISMILAWHCVAGTGISLEALYRQGVLLKVEPVYLDKGALM